MAGVMADTSVACSKFWMRLMSKPAAGTAELAWAPQGASAGSATVYDVVTGSLDDVRAAVPATLESSRNALEWLWNGLPSAERFVAACVCCKEQKRQPFPGLRGEPVAILAKEELEDRQQLGRIIVDETEGLAEA